MVSNNKKTLLDTTRLICQSSLLSTHSLRHIRLSRCKALLSHHFTRTFALALSHCLAPCLTLSFTQEAFLSYVSLGSFNAAMTGHHLPMIAQPRGARSNPLNTETFQPGVEPAKASCILVRARAYRCTICFTCSSSSRCRMRRKFFSSGMEKACHCKERKITLVHEECMYVCGI